MTVASEVSEQTFICTGGTAYAVSQIYWLVNGDIEVYRITAAGVVSLLTETTDYTLTGAGVVGGGTLTTVATYADGKIKVVRAMDFTQSLDLVEGDGFRANTMEAQLDRQVMMAQELKRRSESSFRLADSDTSGASTEIPAPEASKLLGWNLSANALENKSVATIYGESVVSTVAALRNIDGTASGIEAVTVLGYYAAGDGGGGPKRCWVSGAAPGTYVDNGGSIIVPTDGDGSGAWLFTSKQVYADWFGARPGYDSGAAINTAIVVADGKTPVLFNYGTYLSSVKILANISRTILQGPADSEYTPTAELAFPPTCIKFTAALAIGIDTETAINVVLRNLFIDGDGKVETVINYGAGLAAGLNGASQMIEACTIRGGTVQGVLADAQVYFILDRSDISANAKGFTCTTFINLLNIKDSKIKNNTGIGVDLSGTSGFVHIQDTGLENNEGTALKINGTFVNLKMSHIYFENAVNPAPTYFIEFSNTTPANFNFQQSGNVVENCTFNTGSGVQTIVANVTAGKLSFRDCNLFTVDQRLDHIITATTGTAWVCLENSFESYITDSTVHRPQSLVHRETALFAGTSSTGVDVSAKTINLGSGDFTVNAVMEIEDTGVTAVHAAPVIVSAAGGLDVSISGNRDLVSAVAINANGAEAITYEIPYVPQNLPFMLTVVRTSGVVTVYLNAMVADSKADVTNYNANIATVLGPIAFQLFNVKLYNLTIFNNDLTSAQVETLYRCGGNADAARLTSDRKLNLRFDNRLATKVYDTVSATALTLGTDVAWLATTTPAH